MVYPKSDSPYLSLLNPFLDKKKVGRPAESAADPRHSRRMGGGSMRVR